MKWAVISTWKMAMEGTQKAAGLLSRNEKAANAVVEGVTVVEDDPHFCSVGYSGLPDKDGRITLDGGFMDGDTLRFGAVGCIEGFRSPIRIARKLSEYDFNNFLVGTGAEEFALENGFEKRDNMTEETWQKYLAAKDNTGELTSYDGHDTVCMIGKDTGGSLAVAVSTSGLFMKHHGRVGDSPVVGGGFYADSLYGSAAVTGVGEDSIRGALSHTAVVKMAEGKSAQQAVDEAIRELTWRIGNCRSLSMIALDKDGNFGVATNCDFPFVYASNDKPLTLFLATKSDSGTAIREIAPEEWEKD
ncbi:MAG: N(4)-(beta-N-acetylglucosaminyl)-L-asparaginase [Erysipelotrichaceae bacterium]|nr:N(4)-(beta-N-acetylglucosaminyl)-L-asparaginase [Erysipelotrichaceae bacterium]